MSTRTLILAVALITAFGVSHSASLREERFQLAIERGPLVSILEQLSDQTGLLIGAEISVAKSATRDFGAFTRHATADEALRELLGGSDLWYAWRGEDTIRVFLLSAQRTSWSSGVSTAEEASNAIRALAGVHYDSGLCGEFVVGPFSSDEPITAEAAWVELIRPHCRVIREPTTEIEPGSIDRTTLAGQAEHEFFIDEAPRILALQRIAERTRRVVRYLSSDPGEEQALVGPIQGRMSLDDALERAMRGSVLHARWIDDDTVSVEPAYTMMAYADMSKCACNFGLPERWPIRDEHVTVIKPRLPPLEAYAQAPVTVLDRDLIEATGASTIPELLNYLPQQAFNRSRAHRPNAAQYFEGRGFGAQYALVLIDGHRAYGSAGDPITNAFDLNMVPLSAVERIEFALDQPSLLYGTDAIGGTVNIVLRRDLEDGAAAISLGSASGGAEKNAATLLADGSWGNTRAGFILDYLARGDLLGSKRERWRNQDFSRYPGGRDYRWSFTAPPNIHAISGELPGIGARSAAIVIEPGGPVFLPHTTNLESALAHAAIVPEQERSSLYGFTTTALGSTNFKFGLLLARQMASLQLFPVGFPGLTWGANHPQNPFDVDVIIEPLLTGVPPRQEARSMVARGSANLSGSFGAWEYSTFLVAQEDRSRIWLTNQIDPSVLAHSLVTDDPAGALNVLSDRPGEGPLPARLLLPLRINAYLTRGVQYGLNLSGKPVALPAGDVIADIGVAHRQEDVRFDPSVGRLERDISSVFSRLRVPIVSASSDSTLRGLELAIGARRDIHSDVRDVTTWQYGLTWQPTSAIKVHAGYSDLFRPPSLHELYLPRFSLPAQVFDPRRDEVAAVTLVTGGNPSLHPTGGQSVDFSVAIDAENGWRTSLTYWQTQMRNRISAVLLQDLANAPAHTVEGRVLRAAETAADIAAGHPGRLMQLDISRANFGAVNARGLDFSMQREISTPVGRITPRIDIARTLDFRYRDLPAASSPMQDRAGVASLYGTVPSARAVASISFEFDGLRASAFARHHRSYQDYSTVAGAATDHRIPDQTLLDIKVTIDIGDHLILSLGANNVLDDRPPFAQMGGWEGFDQSQGDLVGREAFLDVTGSF